MTIRLMTAIGAAVSLLMGIVYTAYLQRSCNAEQSTLRDHLANLLPSENNLDSRTKYTSAFNAVEAAGSNALPTLLEMLVASDSRMDKLLSTVRKTPLEQGKATMQRKQALTAFRILGPRAAPAIPALSNLVINADSGGLEALDALVLIGKESLPAVLAGLTNNSPAIRARALIGSVMLYDNEIESQAICLAMMSDPAARVRLSALTFFPTGWAVDTNVVAQITHLTADSEESVRSSALRLLSNISAVPIP